MYCSSFEQVLMKPIHFGPVSDVNAGWSGLAFSILTKLCPSLVNTDSFS
jgi:hypothetical protein